MIITLPLEKSTYISDDKTYYMPSKTLAYDMSRSGDLYMQQRAFEYGEQMIRPMSVQKGDGIHAMPWVWMKKTVENSDFMVETKTSLHHNNGSAQREIEETRNINVAEHIIVSQDSPFLVGGLPKSTIDLIKSTAILKAQASLNKQVASLPLLFAERKATLKTIGSYSKFILNNAITMQRKDVKKWLNALKRKKRPEQLKTLAKQIADRHLEFVFGVLPILSEIEDSVKHFSKPRLDVRTGRGRDRRVVETEGYETVNVTNGLFNRFPVFGTVVTVTRSDFSTRCDLRCSITSHVANDASLLGFNPLYTWYDMTPLSFVVGWFSNFNTWVQSLDPLMGLEYVTGSSSHKDTRTVAKYMKGIHVQPNPIGEDLLQGVPTVKPQQSSVNSVSYDDFVREVHSEMPGIQPLRLMDKTSFFAAAASLSLTIQRMVKDTNREIAKKPFRYRSKRPRNLPPITYRK